MSDALHPDTLTIEPAAREWPGLVSSAWEARRGDGVALRFREQLGLPVAGPIIMSGHQAQFWHPGILAKLLAAAGAAEYVPGARAAWVTVDQDTGDPWALSLPTPSAGRVTLRLGPKPAAEMPIAGLAVTRMPGAEASGPLSACLPGAAAGARPIITALEAHADASDGADQIIGALADLTRRLCPSPVWFRATAIARTEAFAPLVTEMAGDARGCVEHYNRAAGAHPGAGIRPLELHPRTELPLWHLAPGKARRRVYADEVSALAAGELAPRALLMTALLRRYGCDLFIHGLGGGVYDRVTDAWIGAWRPEWRLAPTAVVTATRYLSFEGMAPVPTPAEIAAAHWLAHRAAHDPRTLGDNSAANAKERMVDEIAAAKGAGRHPAPAYRTMHEFLGAVRSRHAEQLESLRTRARELAARGEESAVVFDRMWAFPLYESAAMEELGSQIRGAFQR